MIIINQERTKIINFEKITEITASGTKILVGDDIFVPKGEERAKEVLQEIIKAYKETNYEYENCWCLRNVIYEMPEK